MTLRTIANSRLVDGAKIDNLPTNTVGDLAGKQATLVSGANIKTINGQSIIGSGDLTVSSSAPLHGNGSPEGVVTSRYVGDIYIDDINQLVYINFAGGVNIGWMLIQTTPAI